MSTDVHRCAPGHVFTRFAISGEASRSKSVRRVPSAELFHIWIQRAIVDGGPARVYIGFLTSSNDADGVARIEAAILGAQSAQSQTIST